MNGKKKLLIKQIYRYLYIDVIRLKNIVRRTITNTWETLDTPCCHKSLSAMKIWAFHILMLLQKKLICSWKIWFLGLIWNVSQYKMTYLQWKYERSIYLYCCKQLNLFMPKAEIFWWTYFEMKCITLWNGLPIIRNVKSTVLYIYLYL